jgi:hypothetical protein
MKQPLRIAFAGRFYWHNGSSHALLGYVRAGRRLGYDVRASMLGIVDEIVQQKVPVAAPDWKPDLMVLVCEERFLKPWARRKLEVTVPRSQRVLIDPDGRYSQVTKVGGDWNHRSQRSRNAWASDFERLSDIILQPTLGMPAPGASRFLYFGVDVHRDRPMPKSGVKAYDILYVGNNWYRWHDVVWLVNGLSRIRATVSRIAIFGQWWFGDPVPGCEPHTYSDPEFLRANQVETYPSVPFDHVEVAMGRGRLSPILIRPVLNALDLATPRMFETFAADTVPVLPPYFRHAAALYGDDVEALRLPNDPADAVGSILDNYPVYVELAREIRAKLAREHSYKVRLSELVDFGLS